MSRDSVTASPPAPFRIGKYVTRQAFVCACACACAWQVTWQMIFMNNLLPVTIGNTIAGAIFMAGSYALMYGKPSK